MTIADGIGGDHRLLPQSRGGDEGDQGTAQERQAKAAQVESDDSYHEHDAKPGQGQHEALERLQEIDQVGMTFQAHSRFTNKGVVDYFVSNTVLLGENGAEVLTSESPQTLILT